MTIEEAIYAVFEGTGKTSDDYPVGKRFVYNELKNAYKELVRQDLNKYRMWDSHSCQTLSCLELERVDAASCLDCESGIFVLRSKIQLPDILETDFGPAITGVYLMNGVRIDKKDRYTWQRNKKRRYQLPDNYGIFPVNKYLYLVDYDDVDELIVDVEAFFNDPELISQLNNKKDNCGNCTPVYQLNFDCPGHLTRRVIEITRDAVFRKLGIPIDRDNNAKSDLNVPSKA